MFLSASASLRLSSSLPPSSSSFSGLNGQLLQKPFSYLFPLKTNQSSIFFYLVCNSCKMSDFGPWTGLEGSPEKGCKILDEKGPNKINKCLQFVLLSKVTHSKFNIQYIVSYACLGQIFGICMLNKARNQILG